MNDETPDSVSGRICRRRVLKTMPGLAVTAGFAGCAGGRGGGGSPTVTDTPTAAATPTPITFGTPNAAAAGVSPRVVRDQALAPADEIDLSLELGPPPELFTKLQGQAIESSTFPVISGARLANRGGDIRLLQPIARSFNSIIARKGVGLSSVEDLRAVTLGSMPKNTAPFTHFALLLALEGMDHENFQFQFGPPPVLFGQMKNGEIDAMIGVEPFSTRLLATDEYREFFVFNDRWNDRRGTDMPLVEAATYKSTLDEKRDAFETFLQALLEAGQSIQDSEREVFEQYADILGLQTDSQIDLAAERISPIYPTDFASDLRESGKEVVRLAAEEGLIESEPAVDELFFDPRTG
jgi:ABC-type nitrate/sulfonate/bicarbonate transport system substrate-binding protein